MSELEELMKAVGYVAGEVSEALSDGLGVEDLKSLKDLYDNRELLAKGFNVPGDFKEHLEGLDASELVNIILAAKAGYDLGLK